MGGGLGASEKAHGRRSRRRLGCLLTPQLGLAQAPCCREKVKEKKGSHSGWSWGGQTTALPKLARSPQPQSWREGEATGSARESREQRQVTKVPLAAPEVGLGIEVQRLVATCLRSHSKAGKRRKVMCGVHTLETPRFQHPWKDSTQELGAGNPELGCLAQSTGAQGRRRGEPVGAAASAERLGHRRSTQRREAVWPNDQ